MQHATRLQKQGHGAVPVVATGCATFLVALAGFPGVLAAFRASPPPFPASLHRPLLGTESLLAGCTLLFAVWTTASDRFCAQTRAMQALVARCITCMHMQLRVGGCVAATVGAASGAAGGWNAALVARVSGSEPVHVA